MTQSLAKRSAPDFSHRSGAARARRYSEAEIDVIAAKYHDTRDTRRVALELTMSRTTVLKYDN